MSARARNTSRAGRFAFTHATTCFCSRKASAESPLAAAVLAASNHPCTSGGISDFTCASRPASGLFSGVGSRSSAATGKATSNAKGADKSLAVLALGNRRIMEVRP